LRCGSQQFSRLSSTWTERSHGWREYAKWHLGIDDEHGEETKERYTFPYGDFEKVHRCGLLAAESRAGQYEYADIERAAHKLHELIESLVKS
jgi:hypothetical protein